MRIEVKRTGGFAGLEEDLGAVDTAQLDPDAAREVRRLVQQSAFFTMPDTVEGGEVGADLFRYDITVSDERRRHTVTFAARDDAAAEDDPATAPLRRLVERVTSGG